MIYEKIVNKLNDKVILDGYFKSSDGLETIFFKRLKYKHEDTKDDFNLNFIFIHDLLEYHGRYLDIANRLLQSFKNRSSVSLIDLRGHGLSTGTRHYVEDFESFSKDLILFLRYLKIVNEDEKNKFIIVGQGMGALVCLDAYLKSRDQIDGLIISNPILKSFIPFVDILSKNNRYLKWPYLAIKLPFHLNGFDIVKNIDLAEKFNSDPLVGHYMTLGLMLETLDCIKKVKKKSYLIDKPTLMLTSKDSTISDYNMSKIFYKSLDKDHVSYSEFDRMKHDILNCENKKVVFKTIISWLNEKKF